MTTSKRRTLRAIDPSALERVCGGWIDGSWFSADRFTQESQNKFIQADHGNHRSDSSSSSAGYDGSHGHNSR